MRSLLEQEKLAAVLTSWALFGSFGLGLILSGFSLDQALYGIAGFGLLIAGFIAHMIINHLFGTEFNNGEIVVGIMTFGVGLACFLAAWVTGAGVTGPEVLVGLGGFAAIILGFAIYLVTRYGLTHSFSMFHGTDRH